MIALNDVVATRLEPDDPALIKLVKRALERFGNMPRYLPTHWLGVKKNERLLACVGLMPVTAGLRIDYLLFDGISGFRQMVRLVDWLNAKFAGTTLFFNVQADNRVMRAFFESRGGYADWVGYRRDAR